MSTSAPVYTGVPTVNILSNVGVSTTDITLLEVPANATTLPGIGTNSITGVACAKLKWTTGVGLQLEVTNTSGITIENTTTGKPTVFCIGGATPTPITLKATFPAGSAPTTNTWTVSGTSATLAVVTEFTDVRINPTSVAGISSISVKDAAGCTSPSYSVTTARIPTAQAGTDVTLCAGGASVQLEASGGTSYAWSPSTGLSAVNISNPVANPTTETTYTVMVTDALGCTDSDEVIVKVGTGSSVPVASVATAINAVSFTANWGTVSCATGGYKLDISLSSTFNSYVTGYSGLLVGGTSRVVTGLTPSAGRIYYYRVRSVLDGGGESASSNVIQVKFSIPAVPVINGVSPGNGQVTIRYTAGNATDEVSKYIIKVSPGARR
ncbi:hypothetical protein HC928_21635 [bacterium]|nr:hypothetical protein [bacterium]